MGRRIRKGKKKVTKQSEMTQKLKDASGVFKENPLCDPEQRKSFYNIDPNHKEEGAHHYGKTRKKKNQQHD